MSNKDLAVLEGYSPLQRSKTHSGKTGKTDKDSLYDLSKSSNRPSKGLSDLKSPINEPPVEQVSFSKFLFFK